jgi:hypothetical protein
MKQQDVWRSQNPKKCTPYSQLCIASQQYNLRKEKKKKIYTNAPPIKLKIEATPMFLLHNSKPNTLQENGFLEELP